MTKRTPSRQLALALSHGDNFSREDFLEGPCNAQAVELIDRWPNWPDRFAMLVGPYGSGKSHLASIWAANSGARVTGLKALGEAAVPDMLVTGALVIEDVDGPGLDERALFHLLNLARQQKADVLMTARTSPVTWPIAIPDLMSRLRALPVVNLAAPDDSLLRALVVKMCVDRQLKVDESTVNYVCSRIERSYSAAQEAVALLDREALQQGRPVTRALAAELFRS